MATQRRDFRHVLRVVRPFISSPVANAAFDVGTRRKEGIKKCLSSPARFPDSQTYSGRGWIDAVPPSSDRPTTTLMMTMMIGLLTPPSFS